MGHFQADFPVLNTKLEGATFSKILGVKNDCLENFLLDKKIKGPCWLDVSNPKKAFIKKTWCSVELSCSTNDVSLCESTDELPNPPLTLLSFHMRCTDQTKAIVLISWAVLSNYNIWNEDSNVADDQINCSRYRRPCKHRYLQCCQVVISVDKLLSISEISAFTYVNSETEELSELKGLKRTRIEKMKSEKDMLTYFLRKFNETDPDLVVGYDIHNKEFHTFLNRLESLRIEDRNKLSKFKRAPKNLDSKKFVFNGRIVCDLRHLAKSFDLSRNYELNELLSKFLGVRDEQRWVVDFRELISPTGTFTNIAELKEKFLETFVVATKEPLFLLKLALKTDVIPLAFKLTEISGNILWQTFTLGITKKCENLIVHALNEENFVVPSKMLRDKSKTENQLIGGLVLEPNVGYYDNYVLLMDFQSLYPSIIHEYNLCITHDVFPDSDSRFRPVGVLPNLMKNLINKRKLIKDEMNRNHANNRYRHNIYQSSIKLLSNGIYGSLAAPFFRFYSPTMAQEITKQARKILTETVDLLKGQGYEIIYGDTDSLMINTNSTNLDFARETGEKIRGIVNSEYSSINLKIDAVFKKLMIVTKKKYAGNVVDLENGTEEIVLKGLDIVRYDCPVYVNQVGQKIVDLILSELSLQEKHEKIKFKLQTIKKQLLNDEVPKEKLVITKYLTQDLNSCLQDVPHVQLAKRLNQTSSFKFNNGDAVSFIMCSDKNKTFSQKPFHITELTLMKNLEIDGHYYINIQIYPFVSKICRLIGLEYEQIEEYLGVNATKSEEVKIEGGFDRRDPFIFDCLKCGRKNVLEENGDVLDKCSNPDCDSRPLDNPSYLQNRLVINLRCYVQKYYKYELECSECSHRTSRLTFKYKNCPKCGKETLSQVFNEVDLFLQIQYFKYIFQNALGEFKFLGVWKLSIIFTEKLLVCRNLIWNRFVKAASRFSEKNLRNFYRLGYFILVHFRFSLFCRFYVVMSTILVQ